MDGVLLFFELDETELDEVNKMLPPMDWIHALSGLFLVLN